MKRGSGSYKLIRATTVKSWWFLNQPETTKVAIVERQPYTVSGGSNVYSFFQLFTHQKASYSVFYVLHRNVKSSCQRKLGKILKMPTEGGQKNK